MLRRIHDPERGAGYIEYTAVILLVAALFAVLITSGIGGQISSSVAAGVESILNGTSGGDGGGGDDGGSGTGETGGTGGDGDDGAEESGDAPDTPQGEVTQVSDNGGGGGGDDDDGGGFLSWAGDGLGAVWDGVTDFGTGVGNAASDAWNSVGDAWNGLVDGAQRLWDDPGQWVSDTWDSLVDGVTGNWDAFTDDPVGWGLDLLFSEETQENWNNGNYLEAIGQGVAENAVALIPYFGWGKKIDRLNDMADNSGDDGGGGDGDGTGEQRADGDQEGENAESPSCRRPSSFVPGTPVLLADGTMLPIEEIEVGDTVLAFDPLTGEEGPREVTALVSSIGTKTLITLTVDDGGGATDTITATAEHPFWVPDRAEWVDAAALEPGTWLRTSAGTWVQITAVDRAEAEAQRVHNLTVADLHTYYVGAGAANALVHNTNGDCHPDREYREDDDGVQRPVGDRDFAAVAAQRAHEIMRGTNSRNLTVAVTRVYNTETGEFEVWVTSSNPKGQNSDDPGSYANNPPAGFDLNPGEIYVPGRGHAENALRDHLNRNPQYRVVEGGTSSNICQGERSTGNCMPIIEDELGLETGGDYPGTTYTSGKREFWWEGG
ncbi:intein N-terminal splicing region [Marinactinospora thermotolerans DSM 45154]|uniref:Intein N-terminal splicing region n=1 Tax=Marinactinospora thermotolerans DSM 45154 TaxID=1122192 RepID=A0A1T4QEC9_9ACTN|nr:polymorphic toxin-type HINT domain-containing protein [Marinactinospora thermotolerans]SKA02160.1 intein N-terminal splicing region [Marinactinospora thermotolerans DSM 45154]